MNISILPPLPKTTTKKEVGKGRKIAKVSSFDIFFSLTFKSIQDKGNFFKFFSELPTVWKISCLRSFANKIHDMGGFVTCLPI